MADNNISSIKPHIQPQKTLLRAGTIFCLLFTLLFLNSSITIYAGWKSGELKKRITDPAKNALNLLAKSLTPTPKPTPIPIPVIPTASPKPTPTPFRSIPRVIYYTSPPFPTYFYPTPIPGRPGSKEWEDEFWRKWDEMTKKNEESQRKVEEAQKKFCEENPSLCR